MWAEEDRLKRQFSAGSMDQRTGFQKDYDRILYSSALRRLAGITQIVRAGEADVFHTRQQHTFKVAQIGRRLAQICKTQQQHLPIQLQINEDVVEAACLAHDLGHPPFGHMGEYVLDDLCVAAGDADGFEGNAQSFRIISKLAMHKPYDKGLNLTRATMAACIKYPWYRDHDNPDKSKKWGAYRDDTAAFEFAREFHEHDFRTFEAEIMDWADDVTYSVHDLDDFHRCGVLPWNVIFTTKAKEEIVSRALRAWHKHPDNAKDLLEQAADNIEDIFVSMFGDLLSLPYNGSSDQRVSLRMLNSQLIGRFISALTLKDRGVGEAPGRTVEIKIELEAEVRFLKQITRDYIVSNPSLAAQQRGQRRVIEFLFKSLQEDGKTKCPAYLPQRLQYLWNLRGGSLGRFCADCIASLTESEAMKLYARISGADAGSVLDPIVR